MSDLSGWIGPLSTGPFLFGERARKANPLVVSVRGVVVEPGPDGPRETGAVLYRRFVDGELVEEHRTEAAP